MTTHDYRHVIVTTVKDEGPYIVDWVAYHLAIGFTHFVVMGNDISDGSDKILRAMQAMGIVTYAQNTPPYPKGIQKTAYGRMRRFDAVQQADWLIALDLDEYFRVDIGDGRVDDIVATIGDGVALSLVWHAFGHNGIKSIADRPAIEQFTSAADDFLAQPYQMRGLKTLFRRDAFERIGTHRPITPTQPLDDRRAWYDGDLRRINHFGDNGYWCAWNNGVAFGTGAGRINHYALRSKDAFQLKLRRGFSNRVNYGVRGADDPMNYWRSFDWNSVENYRILRHADTANKIAAELKSDPKIAKWHHFAVALHQEQADNLERVDDGLPADARKALADFGQRLDALAPQRDIAELEGTGLLNPLFPTMFSAEFLAQIAHM